MESKLIELYALIESIKSDPDVGGLSSGREVLASWQDMIKNELIRLAYASAERSVSEKLAAVVKQ